MRSRILPIAGIALSIAAVAGSGCSHGKLKHDRWQALRIGQSRDDVKAALGKPLDERRDRLTFTKPKDGIAVEAWFDPQNETLTFTQWSDPVHGIRSKGDPPSE
ncbi:MAG: hypothetical protein JXA69_19405 [Phycisphaerae bacterium]|nr:hypothetical protein [Phycisphaerae bacterium]